MRLWGWALFLPLFLAACQSPGTASESTASSDSTPSTATTSPSSAECAPVGGGTPWTAEASTEATVAQEASGDTAGVALALYPRPDYEGKPWSHWGQGIVSADGRFFSALGDHQGADGNSFIYEYDPTTMTLTRVVDVLAAVDHEPGAWGFGKIHAQMVAGGCDQIYVATYWGTRRGLTFTNGYEGDVLLRLDPSQRMTEEVGVILPEHGVASMAASPDGSLIYAEAADPFGQKAGSFIALDPTTGEVVFSDDDEAHGGYRSIAVAADGSAYITWNDSELARYDPTTNALEDTGMSMPGAILRAVTVPDAEGRIYAVSRDPAIFFVIEPDGQITELGPAAGYTASMALAPDGEHFYYVPDAHGGAWESGTPLISVDTSTGESTVVVELNPLVEDEFGLRAGGTYNVVVSADGSTVFVALNAGDPATRDTFGEIVLAVVTLP
jgi:sugar lactone lactonase YvrE